MLNMSLIINKENMLIVGEKVHRRKTFVSRRERKYKEEKVLLMEMMSGLVWRLLT